MNRLGAQLVTLSVHAHRGDRQHSTSRLNMSATPSCEMA